MKVAVICYKTIKPTIYNEGTKWESRCDHFLAYTHFPGVTIEQAQLECDKLNNEHPDKLFNGIKIDWNKIAYFYPSYQEEFSD